MNVHSRGRMELWLEKNTVDIHILAGTMLALGMTTPRSPRSVLKKKINKKRQQV